MAKKVFISYRRRDSAGSAGRIRDRLAKEFGSSFVFFDVDSIHPGDKFPEALRVAVAKCDVLLAIIGLEWLDVRDEQGRRLDNPEDFVRIEIAAALARGVPVIPILLENAKAPREDQLPDDLKRLAFSNGLNVRHVSFHDDMNKLVGQLRRQEEKKRAAAKDLLVRVERDAIAGERVEIGAAYPVAHERILVARHVIANKGQAIDPGRITLFWQRRMEGAEQARVKPGAIEVAWDGGTEWDAALLKCPFPADVRVPDGILDDRHPRDDEEWSSEGFAAAGKTDEGREPAPLQGKTCACAAADKLFTLVAEAPPDIDGWGGVSGAPVFVGDRILGVILDTDEDFSGRSFRAIPMFRLLALPEFRKALLLPHCAPIDRFRFTDEVSKQFQSAPNVIELLDIIIRELDLATSPSYAAARLLGVKERAAALTETLFDMPLPDATEILGSAIGRCTTAPEDKEQKVLFTILYWLSPALYDLEKSEEVRRLYQQGDVHLIEAHAATALAAELIWAAANEKAARLDPDKKEDPVGKQKLPDPPPLGLGASEDEKLIAAVDGFLFAKFCRGAPHKGKAETFRPAINANLNRDKKFNKELPYLLLGGGNNKIGLTEIQLKALAAAVRRVYPCLPILCLSDAPHIHQAEFEYLHPLRRILQESV